MSSDSASASTSGFASGPATSSELILDEILTLISSHLKLDRDKGVRQLDALLARWESEVSTNPGKVAGEKNKLETFVLENLGSLSAEQMQVGDEEQEEGLKNLAPTPAWEMKHGCLMLCYPLIASMNSSNAQNRVFLEKIQSISLKLLVDEELRVQLAAGGVLGFLSKTLGPSVYQASRETIMELITKFLDVENAREEELISPEMGFDVRISAHAIKEKVTREATEWQNLEPSLKCLQFMIENLNADFVLLLDQKLVNIVMRTLSYPNRYVRETGFQICTALIVSAPENVMEFGHQLSQKLSSGLSDQWNQVRIATLVATRKFLTTYKNSADQFFPCLLPKICLNRYYKAEGVRVFAQETWQVVVGFEGRNLVGRFIQDFVKCYEEAILSDNPAERESSCACMNELIEKIDAAKPYFDRLLKALIKCSGDECWAVKDAAALSFGNFTRQYPDESKPYVEVLYDILFKNLEDPNPLLRQGAATSLANIIKSYGLSDSLLENIRGGLANVDKMENWNTEPNSCRCPRCLIESTGPIDEGIHGQRIMAPAGCTKVYQPWHLTDGCLYLVGALAELSVFQNELTPLIPLMIATTNLRNYGEHFVLVETLCKIIPPVAKSVGKKIVKENLELAFVPIFYAVESQSPVTAAQGKNCLAFLSEFLGPNILRSRVENYDSRFVPFLNFLETASFSRTGLD